MDRETKKNLAAFTVMSVLMEAVLYLVLSWLAWSSSLKEAELIVFPILCLFAAWHEFHEQKEPDERIESTIGLPSWRDLH